MHHTNIEVFKIAQTRVNWSAVFDWLKFIGVLDPAKVISSLHIENGSDAAALIALCGKRCYASFDVESGLNPNVTKIRTDLAEYITNILKSGHGSVLEHATWSFAIENVSRVFTGEMNRHRAGVAVSEGSMRYIRFDDIGFTMPSSLNMDDHDDPLQMQKANTIELIEMAFANQEALYLDLCRIWKIGEMKDFDQKKRLTSLFRRIIGMGVSTGGVWTLNARAARHIMAMRGSKHAEEEIYDVFGKIIIPRMMKDEPLLFGDFVQDEEGSWIPKHAKI